MTNRLKTNNKTNTTMKTSETIKLISASLIKAQGQMSNASKSSSNPFFKSKYADLNSIREACMPALNENGIVVLQPTIEQDGKKFVETVLLHESGEFLSCITEVLLNKVNDAQAQGSGISYARRYGLQSFLCIGAEDDDATEAVKQATIKQAITEMGASKTLDEVKNVWLKFPNYQKDIIFSGKKEEMKQLLTPKSE